MQMNVAEAKAKLSELMAAADAGEEVIIARDGKPAARIVSVTLKRRFRIGIATGEAGRVPDFLEPMPEDDIDLWG
jgi:prevent-host-death family protein